MRYLHLFFSVAFSVNGLFMVLFPETWFNTIPGAATGPFNAHFVRDVGAAYLVCGLAFGWLLWEPIRAWPAALGGCLFLMLHGTIHISEVWFGAQSLSHLLGDVPTVLVLPAVALWSAWPRQGMSHA